MDIYSEGNSGEVVGVSSPTILVPEPEIITRTDEKTDGRWTVYAQPTSSNSAFAVIDQNVMSVPVSHDEISRHIQAHEMTHAKISPSEKQMGKVWSGRGYASVPAMVACEELRVHSYLTAKGFETSTYIRNGAGEYIGSRCQTLHEATLNAIRFARTAEYEPFLKGVLRNFPQWEERIRAIVDGAISIYGNLINSDSNHTRESFTKTSNGVRGHGFRHTESCAQWVELMVMANENETVEKPANNQFEQDNLSPKKSVAESIKNSAEAKSYEHKWGAGLPAKGIGDMWQKLNIATPMLTRNAVGSIGKKRTAAQFGKNPRRISRLYSDPQMRIFDRVTRGTGGVVIIDNSGSMSLSEAQVKKMLESAPSATVATYSAGRANQSNLWVIGRKGKMVDTIPQPHGGNGVDGPALEWAVKQRKNPKDPIIWVSDGGVTGKSDHYDDNLVMACIAFCKRHNIYVVPDAEDAVTMLKQMQQGQKVSSIIPQQLASVYRSETGRPLEMK